MITIVLKTIVMYAFLIAAIRMLGKRQLGELEVSELVTTLMVSELAVTPINTQGMTLRHALVPVLTLVLTEVAMSIVMVKIPKAKRIFSATPSILIRNGKIDQKSLKDARIGVDELLSALRQSGYSCVGDIGYAILESNGKLTVIPTAEKSPVTCENVGIKNAERGIAHGIIIDGYINDRSLTQAGKTKAWLDETLKENGIAKEDVLLLTVDDSGKVSYQLRDK